VIPSADEVLRGWKFVARRIGLEPVANVRAVEAALDHARALSKRPADDPAAIFYAFACRPRALVGGGRYVPALMADRPSFDEVCAWFDARLTPR
jgi:hypothetical protein